MEGEFRITRETIGKVLMEDLVKLKICARLVPLCLTEEQKALRLPACQEPIQSVDEDLSWLDLTTTGDETWCCQYDPHTKRQSIE
jgi:hypothetical protein